MTFTAVKLVQVRIFASIGKAIAKKNGNKGKSSRRPTDDRPTDDDRPPAPPARNLDSNTPLGFQPEG